MAKTLYVIDGHAQIYRAFYAPFGELSSPTGEPTRATHVFCRMFFNLIRDRRPDYLAMTLDPPPAAEKSIFRYEIDEAYKANRDPAPEDLLVQADRIVSIVSALGIPIYCMSGFEADDLMATISHRLRDEDIEVYLVSRDKDLEQLLSKRVRLFDPMKNEAIDPAILLEKKGYTPEQVVDVQTLAGDSTDNVPGVQGVGVKTAAKLINRFGSADAVLEHADELTPKMGERVRAFADQLPVTRQLVTLRRDVPFDFDLKDCVLDRLDVSAARPIFEELGLRQLREILDSIADAPDPAEDAVPDITSEREESVKYELIDTPEALDGFVEKLAKAGKSGAIAFDTETTGLNPVAADLVGLSFCWKPGEAYYLPVRAAVGSVLPVDTVVKKLRPFFESPSVAKVGQNIKYDLIVLRQLGIDVAGVAFDTMIASFLLDPLRSHSMNALAKNLLGHDMIPISDLIGKGKSQITMDQVDTERVCEYAAEDADYTWRLKEVLEPQITGSHVEKLFRETEMPVVEVLVEMEHNGIALDQELLGQLSHSLANRLAELTVEVHKAAGHEFNVDSTKQLAVVLFDEQELPVIRKTKTGRSTDAETLKALSSQTGHEIPKLLLEYRELAKLKSTYVDTLPRMICKRTGRVHGSFNQTGAVTGRLSSSDPNLQNIPIRTETGRQIRAAIIAGDSGSVLLTADYSQIELRLLAHFCQDDMLVEAFRTGLDIHRVVAAQVNGVEMDQVTSAQRSAAKAVNFGIIYGQSAFGLSRSLGIPVGEARAFIDTYFMRYPGIRLFIDDCIDRAKSAGYAETILGRRRPVPELHSRNRQQVGFGERIAVNTVVQGSAADLIKRAMINTHRELKIGDHTARMLIQVHDELVFEVPETDVEREAEMVRDQMENAMALNVPIVADVAWGRTWAEGK